MRPGSAGRSGLEGNSHRPLRRGIRTGHYAEEFAQAITRAREIRDELHVDRAYVQLDRLVKDEGTVERTIIGEDGESQTVSEPIDPLFPGPAGNCVQLANPVLLELALSMELALLIGPAS